VSKGNVGPGAVAQAYNLSYSGSRNQKNHSLKPARAKSSQDPISTNSWTWWLMPVIPGTQGNINRKTMVQADPGIR
jgi:hypothetical protein